MPALNPWPYFLNVIFSLDIRKIWGFYYFTFNEDISSCCIPFQGILRAIYFNKMFKSRTSIFINLFLVYINWFAVAILAGQGRPFLALIPSLGVVGLHLFITSPPQRVREIKVILAAAVVGLIVETFFLHAGIIDYAAEDLLWGYLPPLFMIGLWLAFSTTFKTSLFWLHSRILLSAGIGFLVSGPSYYAGEKLGALILARPYLESLSLIGIVWCVAFPLLLFLSRRI